MTDLGIVFAGTPDFAVPPLRALIEAGYRILAVYTQPDRPAGRGRKLTASPVKRLAVARGLPIRQPQTLRDPDVAEELRALDADLLVVVAYGLILPPPVLAAPRLGCINVHASLLPRWRGAAPIQRSMLAGDSETGVTIMRMEAGLDTGPLYVARSTPIAPGETGGSLHDRLARLGAEALVEALPGIADGTPPPQPQNDALATYAKKLDKDEAMVDWRRPACEIERMIRAFDPWPVAQTRLRDGILRLWRGELPDLEGGGTAPGTVIATGAAGIDVATGERVLRLTRLQLPGKRPMTAAELLNGLKPNARSLEGESLG